MVKRAISSYYDLLDERLKEGTSIILIISFLVFSVWLLSADSGSYKSSIHEYNIENIPTLSENGIVSIDGKQYKIILEEVEK